MKNTIKYKTNNIIIYSCRYYIVWCPKYSRKVLIGDVEKRLKEIIIKIAGELSVEITEMKINENNVQMLCEVNPQIGVGEFIKKVKSGSSKILRDEFHHLRTKLPTLWNKSYLISTVGETSFEVIKQYIKNQPTSERIKEKNKWKDYLKSCEMKK